MVYAAEFSRVDTRKRHEAAHSYSLTCGVCGQYFNRLDNLARHRAQQHLNQDPTQSSDVPCKATIPPSSSQDDFDEEGDTSFTEVSESVVEKLLVADNTAASNSSTTEEAMD